MAKYNFLCTKCNKNFVKYLSPKIHEIECPDCKSLSKRLMPNILEATVKEVIDTNFGVSWVQDQSIDLKKRRELHYWEVEVPRFVETYSIETCLENGWLIYNEKGELEIGKAPSKR